MESSSVFSVFDRLTAVRDADLDSAAKLMLFVLVSYANRNGDAWPSNDRLRADLQLSERQIRRVLTELRHAAIVSAWMEGKTRKLKIDFEQLRALPSTASLMGDTDVPHAQRRGTPTSDNGGHSRPPELSSELSSSLKRESTTRKRDTSVRHTATSKSQKQLAIPDQLDRLIDAWNQLPDGIAPRCNKRSATLVTAWQRATGQPDVAAVLSDAAKLMAAIREGSFLHGQPWFKFSWLFHKSRSGEFNAVKIIEGNYRDSNAKPRASAARWQGDADDFAHLATPAPAAAAAGAGRELDSRSA